MSHCFVQSAATLIIVVLLLTEGAACFPAESWLDLVYEKLDSIARKSDLSSDIVPFDELLLASKEFNRLSEGEKTRFFLITNSVEDFDALPLKRALVELVIKPIRIVQLQVPRNDFESRRKFSQRVCETYKRLRPAYLGLKVKPEEASCEHKWMKELADYLSGQNRAKQLTMKLIRSARREYESLRQRLDEILFNLEIYSSESQTELGLIWNYLNHLPYKAAMETVAFADQQQQKRISRNDDEKLFVKYGQAMRKLLAERRHNSQLL